MEEVMFPVLTQIDTTQQVYTILRQKIMSLDLMPGAKLNVRQVAQAMGVSSTPVKAAFDRLSGEKLVQIVPRQGTFVAPLQLNNVEDFFGVRTALEVFAAEEGCLKATAEQIAELETALEAIERATAGDPSSETFLQTVGIKDYEFHRCMVSIHGNLELLSLYESLKVAILLIRRREIGEQGHRVEITGEHKRIFDAYTSKDLEGLRVAIKTHLHNSLAYTNHLLRYNQSGVQILRD